MAVLVCQHQLTSTTETRFAFNVATKRKTSAYLSIDDNLRRRQVASRPTIFTWRNDDSRDPADRASTATAALLIVVPDEKVVSLGRTVPRCATGGKRATRRVCGAMVVLNRTFGIRWAAATREPLEADRQQIDMTAPVTPVALANGRPARRQHVNANHDSCRIRSSRR
jgi:hypothetical protein